LDPNKYVVIDATDELELEEDEPGGEVPFYRAEVNQHEFSIDE
jgi:hypothetical protein